MELHLRFLLKSANHINGSRYGFIFSVDLSGAPQTAITMFAGLTDDNCF
jgi:hypothetical protein